MRAVKRKVTDMTVDELKGVIHEAISEDIRFGGRPLSVVIWNNAAVPL